MCEQEQKLRERERERKRESEGKERSGKVRASGKKETRDRERQREAGKNVEERRAGDPRVNGGRAARVDSGSVLGARCSMLGVRWTVVHSPFALFAS